MEPVIEIRDVDFIYNGSEKKVLNSVDLWITEGEFVILCGKSGCGKTSLLKQLKPGQIPYGQRTGEIRIFGKEIEELSSKEAATKIGLVQQDPENQIVTDKVWHELAFGLENLGVPQQEILRRVAEVASYFNIQTWFERDTAELSGGQKQLLNLAAVMVMQPELLLLDEPTAQLDPIAAEEFFLTLQKLNQDMGTTILISEHRLEQVFPMADRVIVMEEGRIYSDTDPRQTGKALQQNGNRHPMFYGLPAIMKIAASISVEETKGLPLTVREGRALLKEVMEDADQLPKALSEEAGADRSGAGETVLEWRDVWFAYDRKQEDVLRGVDLAVHKQEWFCILGGNGVGKSTTFKILCHRLRPHRGKIYIHGKEITRCSKQEFYAQKIALLPQEPQSLFTEITVEEELEETFCYEHMQESEKRVRVEKMLGAMGLIDQREQNPYDLSGGEQQRLALGKILLTEPEILLLDEPTKGLDPFFKQELADILLQLKRNGMTIVMISHDIEFCAEYADRCCLFFHGSCSEPRPAKEFFAGNKFYTTAANKMARKWFKKAVTWQEVAEDLRQVLSMPQREQTKGQSQERKKDR